MSVGLPDLVELPCGPELISAGISFACRTHIRPFLTRSLVPIPHIRRICARSIASLSIRRWLTSENVPHSLTAFAPLTDPHLHQIILGGRRLHVISHLITNRATVRRLGQSPRSLLQGEIVAVKTQDASALLSPGDLLAFCILVADICSRNSETARRREAHEPIAAIAIPPRPIWRQQRPWLSLGRLILTNSGNDQVEFELEGLSANRSLVVEHMKIPPKRKRETKTIFHNLLHLRTERIPSATPRLESPARSATWFVTPGAWSNLWFYDPYHVLAGWLTKRDVDRAFKSRYGGFQIRMQHQKDQRSSCMRVQDLRSIQELIQKTRQM